MAEANPYYSSETTETVWHIIAGFIAPLVIGKTFDHPREIYPALHRIRGHNMAKAGVEMAAWDLYARSVGQPLSKVLGGTRDRIASGVSIGIQDSFDQLLEKVEKELAAGYQRIKIKIKPGWDIEAVERIRAKFGDIPLQVDANAAYTLDDAALLARLDPFDLLLIEQPLDYDDVMDHVELQKRMKTPVCLDESIHTVRIARDAIAAGACRSSTSNPDGSAATRRRSSCTICARPTTSRCGMAACSRAASAARTTFTWPACRTSGCPATLPPASVTTSPT